MTRINTRPPTLNDTSQEPSEMTNATTSHLSLSTARATEEQHLATTSDQLAEWSLTIRQAEEKIVSYREAIDGQRSIIADARREQGKLRKKRRIFQVAAFQLGLVDQEG